MAQTRELVQCTIRHLVGNHRLQAGQQDVAELRAMVAGLRLQPEGLAELLIFAAEPVRTWRAIAADGLAAPRRDLSRAVGERWMQVIARERVVPGVLGVEDAIFGGAQDGEVLALH